MATKQEYLDSIRIQATRIVQLINEGAGEENLSTDDVRELDSQISNIVDTLEESF